MSITELSLRVACSFLVLLALTRLMGRKELRQLTFFNFVSGIAIGSIAANLVANETFSIRNGLLALIAWAIFTIVLGILDIKSRKARHLMEGEPVILIQNGRILENSLRNVRLDMNALKALLRQKNTFAVSEVEYAILETDGNLSVMKKEPQLPATKQDMNPAAFTSAPPAFLPTEVISDGKLIQPNIEKLQLGKNWVETQVKQSGLSVSSVFFAELQKDGSLYIDEKHYENGN